MEKRGGISIEARGKKDGILSYQERSRLDIIVLDQLSDNKNVEKRVEYTVRKKKKKVEGLQQSCCLFVLIYI